MMSPQAPIPNPQVALATLDGATNTVPSFITAAGPVREARFKTDGGVHGLYTIQGRKDAPGCTLAQPNFAQALQQNNVIFRIPTPTFGLGLVEATPDATLQANLASNQTANAKLGIGGVLNTSGNDGTVTRFGWKAQNKSLLIFAGEAYNVEQGVSNEVFPNERSAVSGCVFNGSPEDSTVIVNGGSTTGTASDLSSDTVNFAAFMRLSAPPAPATLSSAAQTGESLFTSVGCGNCHSASLTTGKSPFTGMSNVTYHPYSDFAIHHMGSDLADGIPQGGAGPDQFRTAPLWGVGQRLFFLHDGRTADLGQAIEAHASAETAASARQEPTRSRRPARSQQWPAQSCASEANAVIQSFNALSASQQTAISTSASALVGKGSTGSTRGAARAASRGTPPGRAMGGPLTVVVLVAAGGAAEPTTLAIERAASEALGHTAHVVVREAMGAPTDGEALTFGVRGERRRGRRGDMERPGAPSGDAASPSRRAATLDGSDHRVRRRGRRRRARSDDRPRRWRPCSPTPIRSFRHPTARAAGDRPADGAARATSPPAPSPDIAEKTPADVAPRELHYAMDFFGIGAAGLGGNVQTAGGGAALETFLTPRFALRIGGAVRGGDVDGAPARTITLLATAGVELHPWPATASHVFGTSLRADYVLMNQTVTHRAASGADLSTMARTLSGVDAMVDLQWRLGANVDLLVGVGVEEMLATTYVDVNGARVATMPPVSLIAEGGLRLRF